MRILSTLWFVISSILLIGGLLLVAIGNIVRVALPAKEEVGRLVAPLVLSILGGSLLALAAAGLFAGWGLLKWERWGRMLAIVLGIIFLFQPPFGTALGIYTLWVLLSDPGGIEFGHLVRTRMMHA